MSTEQDEPIDPNALAGSPEASPVARPWPEYPPPPGYFTTQGPSTPAGYPPPQGYPAPSGYQPPQGYPAPSGYPPPQGYPAPSGYPPPQGYPAPSTYPATSGYAGPTGYPPYGGYPFYPPNPYYNSRQTRPGRVLAASVLAFILGGFLILAGLMLVFGAASASSWAGTFGDDTGDLTAELVLDGLVNFVAAGLLIAGGIALTGAGRAGRGLVDWGAGITCAASIYWLARTSGAAGPAVYAIVFDALAIVAACLISGVAVTRWLQLHAPRN